MRDAMWFELGDGEGVLELSEGATGDGLELHVVLDSVTGQTIAWWENAQGSWLAAVCAGAASPRERTCEMRAR